MKRDERDDDGESLYRKRGGVVVAAGNNDLDRHFTGIVKERGLIEFLPGTFVLSYRLSMLPIPCRRPSLHIRIPVPPLSINMYSIRIQLDDELIAGFYYLSCPSLSARVCERAI